MHAILLLVAVLHWLLLLLVLLLVLLVVLLLVLLLVVVVVLLLGRKGRLLMLEKLLLLLLALVGWQGYRCLHLHHCPGSHTCWANHLERTLWSLDEEWLSCAQQHSTARHTKTGTD
jgi:hypothetical protein